MKNPATDEFESIDCVPGSFVVNVGTMLERMTRGRLRSTIHRVLDLGEERISAPFFLEPGVNSGTENSYFQIFKFLSRPLRNWHKEKVERKEIRPLDGWLCEKICRVQRPAKFLNKTLAILQKKTQITTGGFKTTLVFIAFRITAQRWKDFWHYELMHKLMKF